MNKARLEAFTDAIIAIAATIMALELKVPAQPTFQGLLSEWQLLLAYVISFIFIYVVWFSHHNIFKKAKNITARTFIYNGIWLFLLTLVPFTTCWVGINVNATFPEFLYVLVMLLWSIMFEVIDRQIIRDNPDVPKDPTNGHNYQLALYGGFLLAQPLSEISLQDVLLAVEGQQPIQFKNNHLARQIFDYEPEKDHVACSESLLAGALTDAQAAYEKSLATFKLDRLLKKNQHPEGE